jgi:hypothetical protein
LEGASFTRNQQVIASYTCDDGTGAGVASCVGTIPSGTAIDTSTLGTRTFTVTATDLVGNTTTVSRTYTVGYSFGGFAPPLKSVPGVNTAKVNQALRIQFRLFDLGAAVSDLAAVSGLSYASASCQGFSSDPANALPAAPAGETSLRFDATTSSFIYNWKAPSARGCYTLLINLSTGQRIPSYFQLK